MFKTEDKSFPKVIAKTEGNYKIAPNDYLNVFVYTNNGERIIDPNKEFSTQQASEKVSEELNPSFLVRENGKVNLPMIGEVFLKGFTLYEADSILSELYSKFYQDVYVITRLTNKRVIVLGALGGKVIPLSNEKMNLIEVISLYGGIPPEAKSSNIRLIRGDLKNPEVEVIDLSTIEGMKKASLQMEPNDIVYIEPHRRLFSESLRDITIVVGLLSNLITITFLASRIN